MLKDIEWKLFNLWPKWPLQDQTANRIKYYKFGDIAAN